jgi:patatin-like phospholipase/acyl hydrolase
MTAYRILIVDRGGIRGVLSATILENLDEKIPGFMNSTDLVTGTSTGGILALALHPTTGKQKLKDIRLLWVDTGLNPKYLTEMNNRIYSDTLK